jgi:2-aminoadipate transaminase
MQQKWEGLFAERVRLMKSSAIREMLKVTELPGCISFAGGLPAPEAFPVEEIAVVTERILREQGARALQYGPTEGYYPLRELIANQLSSHDLAVSPENVLITSGSQQALDLLGRIFLDAGDTLVVESPTYLGAFQAWGAYGVHYRTVPMDEQGMQIERLEEILQQVKPKWVYTLPNFQNPSGVTLSSERRTRLVELTARYQVPVVEDDPYGHLRFVGEPQSSLLNLSGRLDLGGPGKPGHVFYLGTFSKVLAPGLRLGWIVAPVEVISKMVQAKQGVDLHTATLNQMIAHAIASSDFLAGHIQKIRRLYSERRDLMLAALERHFPASVRWTRPEGGLFLWVTLPPEMSATELLVVALKQNVAFVPGGPFFANGGEDNNNSLRLNFSNASPEQIETGIARLGVALRAYEPARV